MSSHPLRIPALNILSQPPPNKIRESVNSLCRDGANAQLMQYLKGPAHRSQRGCSLALQPFLVGRGGSMQGGGMGDPYPPFRTGASVQTAAVEVFDRRAHLTALCGAVYVNRHVFAKMKRLKPLAGAASKRQCCGSADIRQYLLGSRYVTKFTTAALQLQVCRSITGMACISSIFAAVLMHPDASLK